MQPTRRRSASEPADTNGTSICRGASRLCLPFGDRPIARRDDLRRPYPSTDTQANRSLAPPVPDASASTHLRTERQSPEGVTPLSCMTGSPCLLRPARFDRLCCAVLGRNVSESDGQETPVVKRSSTGDLLRRGIGDGGLYGSGPRVTADGTAPRTHHPRKMLRSVPNEEPLSRPDRAPRIAVLIADPHPGTRSAIRNALKTANTVKVVGEAPDLLSTINAVSAGQVDIVLADARLAGLGSDAARSGLEQLSRRTEVIVMGMSDPRVYARPLQAAGAAGYWPKDGDLAQLTGLLDAASHRHPVSQPSASRSATTLPGPARHPA